MDPEQLDRRQQRPRLDRQQPRRAVERVGIRLGVDLDLPARQHLGVQHVRAAAEVDDVEHRDVLAQLLLRHLELIADRGRVELAAGAAGLDQDGGERDEAGEALRPDAGRVALARAVWAGAALRGAGGRARAGGDPHGRLAAVQLDDAVQAPVQLLRQLRRAEHARMLLVADRPREHEPGDRVRRAEHVPAVVGLGQLAVAAEVALHVPGDAVRHPDLGRRARLAELPRDPVGVAPRVEVVGALEVVLRLRGVRDLAADAREPEHADVAPLVRVADEVELPALEQQLVRVDLAQRGLAGLHREVLELDPLAAVDRGVDLGQPAGEVAAARGGGDAEPDRLARVGAERARAAPGDLLQRQAQRLGVGELAVEQRQRRLQRGALGVGEGDRRQMEGLRRERVVLLLGEAVGGLVDAQVDPERVELGAVGVEATRERVLGHIRVSLDVAPDLRRRHRAPLSHQIRDQGELPDELFCVLRHRTSNLRATTEPPATPSLLARGLCAELEPYMPLSLVLIEDHQALREGLELLLSREGLEVIGTAGSAGEGRELVERHSPDVALVDIRLGEDSGIDLTRDLLDADPERRVVLYTGSSDVELLISGLDSGARGYALKEGTPSELTAALNTVAEGGTYVDPRLRPALLSRRATQRMPSLSKREREIMDLLAQGLNGEQVAEKLVLSSETVKTHIRNAMAKLEASTRVHAIAIALREGYIQPPSSDGNHA